MAVATESISQAGKTRFLSITRIFYLMVILISMGVVLFVVFQPITVLPRISLAPGFALVDQNNNQLTNEDMRGGITLYSFTYTGCDEGCVNTTPLMADVYREISQMNTNGVPVELVTIFIDPEDTPEKLQAVSQSLNADSDLWHFVTGSVERVRWVIGGGFGVYYKELDDGSYKLDTAMMLVDGAGIIRAEYIRAIPEFDIVVRDIGLLVDESRNREGAAKYAYEAAHLFLCYPR